MTKERITKRWLKNHLFYSWWKYLALAAGCVFCVDMLFTMTEYRPPEEKKVEIFVLNDYVEASAVKQELSPAFFERCPDQEELAVLSINIGSDDMYARMQFTTYAAAHQGDVYMLPVSEFRNLTAEEYDAFADLAPYLESGVIDIQNIDVSGYTVQNADGTQSIYAIPSDTLYGLTQYGNDPAGSLLCITAFGENLDHAAQALDLMIEKYHGEKPEGYDQMRKEKNKPATLF